MEQIFVTPDRWKTWNGKLKLIGEIDHQHLSNIYWFHLIMWDKKYIWALEEIKSRFNGQLLPYKPHIDFKDEINWLESHGMITWNETTEFEFVRSGIIKYKGTNIGEIVIPTP